MINIILLLVVPIELKMMVIVFVFFILMNQGLYGLKTLSFENLKYVVKENDYYYFEGSFKAKIPDHFIVCSSQHTSKPDGSMVYYIPDHNGNNFITLRLTLFLKDKVFYKKNIPCQYP